MPEIVSPRAEADYSRDVLRQPEDSATDRLRAMSTLKELLLDRLMRSEQHYYRDETPSARDLRTWLE